MSPRLIGVAHEHGYEATSVGQQGLGGTSDRALLPQILGGDFTFVTNNRRDFLRLYRLVDIHAGLLIILPAVNRQRQIELFIAAIAAIRAAGDDLTGDLVEVSEDGVVTIARYPPPGGNE